MLSKTYVDLYVKCQLLLSDFNKLEFSRQILEKYPNIKFY